jgi:type VI secretion system secreted protein Hcp
MYRKIAITTLILISLASFSFAQDSNEGVYNGSGSAFVVLKVDGLDGESKLIGHENEIDVLSWHWNMSQSGSMHIGGGGGSGKATVEDLILTKYVDKSSAGLMIHCLNGTHLGEAILTVVKSGEKPLEYLTMTMTPVLVTSVSIGDNENYGRVIETVTLNFAKVEFNYIPQKDDGTPDAAIKYIWNIEKNLQE